MQAVQREIAQQLKVQAPFKDQAALDTYITNLESDMREAAKKFEFERAAKLRDTIKDLREKEFLFS